MAAATDPQSLANVAACYACGGDSGTETLYLLGLLRLIALQGNPLADVSPQGLANVGACYACSLENWRVYMLSLLAIIAQNGSTGGGGGGGGGLAIVNTFATPNGNVSGVQGAIYVDKNLQTLWVQENAAGGNTGWVQFV